MTFDAPKNPGYAATVVRVPATYPLAGLDNLVGVNVFNSQILSDGVAEGGLRLYFGAETQLSEGYTAFNNLYRKSEFNKDVTETGYLETNRRVKAIKLRGHRSDALLMPLSSLNYTGLDISTLREGDTFDALNGVEVCRKYELPIKGNPNSPANKLAKVFKRVDAKYLPEHVGTDNYFRYGHLINPTQEIVVTAKLHGTSVRISNTIVKHQPTWRDKLAAKLGASVKTHDYDHISGSRKVIKDPQSTSQAHYYGFDLWSREGEKLRGILPQGVIVYGELVGWADRGSPIQAGYDYGIPNGDAELYVYRIARISPDGYLTDLSWDQVVEFTKIHGLKHVPELWRGRHEDFVAADWIDIRFADKGFDTLPLPNKKLVDEGVVVRVEGIVPSLWKIKSPIFLQHETKSLDAEAVDLEAQGSYEVVG